MGKINSSWHCRDFCGRCLGRVVSPPSMTGGVDVENLESLTSKLRPSRLFTLNGSCFNRLWQGEVLFPRSLTGG